MSKWIVAFVALFSMALAPSANAIEVVAVGDAVVDNSTNTNANAVADMIEGIAPNRVLLAGDIQYNEGTYCQYEANGRFGDVWANLVADTYPAGGNHEYYDGPSCVTADDTGGDGTFSAGFGFTQWWVDHGPAGTYANGSVDSTPWYTHNSGFWQFISVSTKDGSMTTGNWADADEFVADRLAASDKLCEVVYWHHPRWTNGDAGSNHTDDADMDPLWEAAVDGGADIVISGHVHSYERFGKLDVNGQKVAGSQGTRLFVVGTGGRGGFGGWRNDTASDGSQKQWPSSGSSADRFGALELTLDETEYTWEMRDETGAVVDETPISQGPTACHD